jgi:hypothetical protein
MLGGTYDVSLVTIFEVYNTLPSHGYVESEFTFNGNYPLIASGNNCSASYYVYGSHRLSNHILNSDYVINIPVLKAHNVGYSQHDTTTAFKNHYGSICPQNLCDNITGMLTMNADTNIKDKTCLVVTSALRGTYNGDPWEPAQIWNTYPEQTPNSLFFTTDPTTEAYWVREMINAERSDREMTPFACAWVEEASGDPYYLGVSDPAQMTVINLEAPFGAVQIEDAPGLTQLAPNVPNPFSQGTMVRFRLAAAEFASLGVIDVAGRMIRWLENRRFPGGDHEVYWDGTDSKGQKVAPGVYFVRLEVGRHIRTRRIVLVR